MSLEFKDIFRPAFVSFFFFKDLFLVGLFGAVDSAESFYLTKCFGSLERIRSIKVA